MTFHVFLLAAAAGLQFSLGCGFRSATASTPPVTAAPANPAPELASPVEAVDRGSFWVSVRGHGPAVILIPGLACGADVWDETVARLEGSYELHTLTLSGFAGRVPVQGPLLPRVREDLVTYIRESSLHRPAVVGHSLGGFMALWLAATEPTLVGPVVSVDGLPSLAAAMNVPEDQVHSEAAAMRHQMEGLSAEDFAAQIRVSLAGLMVSSDDVETVARTATRSDPPTVGKAMYEMLTRDIREDMAAVQTPVLLFGPGVGTPEQRAHVEDVYRGRLAAARDEDASAAGRQRREAWMGFSGWLFGAVGGGIATAYALAMTS